jgi:hypothetical protein
VQLQAGKGLILDRSALILSIHTGSGTATRRRANRMIGEDRLNR